MIDWRLKMREEWQICLRVVIKAMQPDQRILWLIMWNRDRLVDVVFKNSWQFGSLHVLCPFKFIIMICFIWYYIRSQFGMDDSKIKNKIIKNNLYQSKDYTRQDKLIGNGWRKVQINNRWIPLRIYYSSWKMLDINGLFNDWIMISMYLNSLIKSCWSNWIILLWTLPQKLTLHKNLNSRHQETIQIPSHLSLKEEKIASGLRSEYLLSYIE